MKNIAKGFVQLKEKFLDASQKIEPMEEGMSFLELKYTLML